MLGKKVICLCVVLVSAVVACSTRAEQSTAYQERKREANESVVTIMGSGTASPYTHFAEDIQNVVDEPDVVDGLRVLPILGRGGAQSASDVLLLKGVDMAIVEQDDVKQAKLKDPVIFGNIQSRLQYITKISNSEFQIIARADIKSLKDLEGKKINCFKKMSSTQLACDNVFKILKLNAQILYLDQEEAASKLKSGEIDAFVRYAGAPHGAFTGFKATDGFHFVAIDAESVGPDKYAELLKAFSPVMLKNDHYPALIAADQPVPTISGTTLLVVYNWPENTERHAKLVKFVTKFFDNISKFQGPGRHPKWKEINIAYDVPGWTRFKPAQDWINAHKMADNATEPGGKLRSDFDTFLKKKKIEGASLTKEKRDQLFTQFVTWWSANK